jgi:hypothetical protein
MENNGKWLEKEVEKVLKRMQEKEPINYHRFADTYSAGGAIISAQPGDYLVLLDKKAILLEIKSTVKGADIFRLISSSKNAKNQLPRHRLWHRANHPSFYLWGDIKEYRVKVYKGQEIVNGYYEKEIRNTIIPIFSGTLDKLEKAIREMLNCD